MILHALLRKLRHNMPFVYLILIVCFVKFLKELPIPKDNGIEHSLDDISNKEKEDHIITPPKETTQMWLLVKVNESSTCYPLAAKFHGWNILLIGVTEKIAEHSKCHFLGVEDIRKLCNDYRFPQCEQENNERVANMVAMLFILKFNPEAVYVAPKSVNPREIEKPVNLVSERKVHLVTHNNNKSHKYRLFQAHYHFGCNMSSFGRTSPKTFNMYRLCSTKFPVIQAPAIISKSKNNICDNHAPSVVIQNNMYALFNFNGAVISKDAFWVAGLVPLHFKYSFKYLTLTFVIQKLLWLTGNSVKLFLDPTNIKQSITVKDSKRMKKDLEIIDNWQCHKRFLQDCLLEILSLLIQKKYNFLQEKLILNSWLQSLKNIGYRFPGTLSSMSKSCDESVTFIPFGYGKYTGFVDHIKMKYPINNLELLQKSYNNICPGKQEKIQFSIDKPWTQFGNVLLIIVFNNPHYEAIPFVQLLYQSFFPNILFCGPKYPDIMKFPYLFDDEKLLTFSFISYGETPKGHAKGAFNYICTTKAMQMQYNVDGYLTIADDLLLWIHDFVKFPKNNVWFLPEKQIRIGELRTLRECKLGMCDFYPHWHWWSDYQEQIMDVLQYMKEEQKHSFLFYSCYQELIRLNGAEFRANGAYSDIYYIPMRLSKDFIKLSELFLKHDVFLEIAIPTILRCLEPPENVQPLYGIASWDPDTRDYPWQYFEAKYIIGKSYFHPCKWGFIRFSNLSSQYTDYFCTKVLPFMFDRYERIYLLK